VIDRTPDKWFRGGKWGLRTIDESSREYHIIGSQKWFNEWEDSLQYQIIDLSQAHHEQYDPVTETPNAYLEFVHLADVERFRGDAKWLIKEVLRFFEQFGPLWYPGGDLEQKELAGIPPLTIERVLFEANDLAKVVHIYLLLQNLENRERPETELISRLREYMVSMESQPYPPNYHLVTTKTGLRVPGHFYSSKEGRFVPPPLVKDEQVITAAIAYLEAYVEDGMRKHLVYPALANRRPKQDTDSFFGAWVEMFRYSSLVSVLWRQVYSAIINNTCLKECANKDCHIIFEPKRSSQKFHEHKCQNVTNVRNFYSKHGRKPY
jgi:hypothetical protein